MTVERSYRRLLGAYPASWRADHGEDLLGIMLDAADARGAEGVGLMERVDLVRHGLAQRFISASEVMVPSAVRQQAALYALFSLAVVCLTLEIAGEWLGVGAFPSRYSWVGRVGPMSTAAGFVYPFAIVAAVLAVIGRRGSARLLVVAAGGGFLVLGLLAEFANVPAPPIPMLAVLFAVAALAGAAPLPEERPWKAATVAMAVAGVVAPLVAWHGARTSLHNDRASAFGGFGDSGVGYYQMDLWFVSALVLLPMLAFVVILSATILWRPTESRLALLIMSVPWLAFGVTHSVTVVPDYYLRVHPAATALCVTVLVALMTATASHTFRRAARRDQSRRSDRATTP